MKDGKRKESKEATTMEVGVKHIWKKKEKDGGGG